MGLVDLPATYHQNFTIQMHHIMSHNICHYVQPKHHHPKAPSGYICQKLKILHYTVLDSSFTVRILILFLCKLKRCTMAINFNNMGMHEESSCCMHVHTSIRKYSGLDYQFKLSCQGVTILCLYSFKY